MIFKSIKWRLQAWHGFILLVVLAGFGFTAHRLQRANELRRIDDELNQRVNVLARDLQRPPGARRGPPPPMDLDGRPPLEPPPEDAPVPGGPGEGDAPGELGDRPFPPREFHLRPEAEMLFAGTGSNAFYYVVWRRDGSELARSSNAPNDATLPKISSAAARQGTRMRGAIREGYHFTPPGECLLAGRSIEPELGRLREFALWLTGLGGAVLVAGLAGGWWLANRAIRPIDQISATASRISEGNLAERINVADTHNELGQLATVLNSTFARLEAAFARQQQFTADASHELRTPISVVLNQTQTALARERPAAEYREALEACQRAAQRMRRLTESLLTLARLDAGQEPMKHETFDLSRTANECADLVRPLASERNVILRTDLPPVECGGDSERIAQVITNLLVNAIQYNKAGGEVRLVTNSSNGHVTVLVSDTGPGIAAEHLPRLFDRFYRVDPARTTGGSGLGLAIAKAIVAAHGGSIEAHSHPGMGTTFRVQLPHAV